MKKLIYVILLAVGILVGAVSTMALRSPATEQMPPNQKLAIATQIIENYYVEDVNSDTMIQEAIIAMLKTLDPHSAYSTPAETQELNQPLEGKFSGIGIQFNMLEDTVYVIQTTPGGPSEKMGIRPGDRIISANDTVIAGKKMINSDIIKVLRGPKGSVVNVKVKRADEPELITFRLVRDDIPMYSVDAAYMVDDSTAYISVTRFAESTAAEVRQAADSLSRHGMRNLVLDLSSNGGGYLGSAYELASEFLQKGDPVVFTKGLHTRPTYFNVEQTGSIPVNRLVVMVDQYSASAAEILSGAIQENDRGLIVGRRTFGKGLVQRPFPFPDGSMMRLTVSRYYTPSGRCIQKPYTKGEKSKYNMDVIDRYNHGELTNADSIHLADSLKYKTLREGRTVYGGGGIMPDYFIPLDTTRFTKYHRELTAKGAIINASLKYIDKHRKQLHREYSSFDKFRMRFNVPEELTALVVAEGEKEGVKPKNDEEMQATLPELKKQLKALIARDIWDMSEYFAIMYEDNPFVKKALELLD